MTRLSDEEIGKMSETEKLKLLSPVIESSAKRLCASSLPQWLDDVRSEMTLAAWRVAENWKPDPSGTPFFSYGKRCIMNAGHDFLRRVSFCPTTHRRRMKKLEKLQDEMSQAARSEIPFDKVVAEYKKRFLSPAATRRKDADYMLRPHSVCSLDAEQIHAKDGAAESQTSLLDRLEDESSSPAVRRTEEERQHRIDAVQEALASLAPRDFEIVRRHFWANETMEEIGDFFGYTKQNTYALLRRIQRQMRPKLARKLAA